LAAIADRPAHLPGELLGNLVVICKQRIEEMLEILGALLDRHLAPGTARMFGARHRRLDLRARRNRPLRIDPPVDWRDDRDRLGHCYTYKVCSCGRSTTVRTRVSIPSPSRGGRIRTAPIPLCGGSARRPFRPALP